MFEFLPYLPRKDLDELEQKFDVKFLPADIGGLPVPPRKADQQALGPRWIDELDVRVFGDEDNVDEILQHLHEHNPVSRSEASRGPCFAFTGQPARSCKGLIHECV